MGSIITPTPHYPLEGRNLRSVSRDEVIKSIPKSTEFTLGERTLSTARVSSRGVVKWGRRVHLFEAANMRYVSEHTTILLPTVIDAWEMNDATEEEESNTCYILMEFVPGELVIDIWDNLGEEARKSIHAQLYGYIRQLQALEFKIPGPIGGGISEGWLFTAYDAGPFTSSNDLERWYNDRLLVSHDFNHAKHLSPGAFSGTFQKLVMCHLDLNPRNVIIDGEGKAWLIDWGSAGAYPPWFEKAQLSWGVSQSWKLGLLKLLSNEVWTEEVAKISAISFALTTGGYCQPKLKGNNY